jgi:hypothetical protein
MALALRPVNFCFHDRGYLARFSRQLSTAATDPGMSTALCSVGRLEALLTTSYGMTSFCDLCLLYELGIDALLFLP